MSQWGGAVWEVRNKGPAAASCHATGQPVIMYSTQGLIDDAPGLRAQGLADAFILLGMPFDSPEAKQLNKEIFEAIYFAALETSCELAKADGADMQLKRRKSDVRGQGPCPARERACPACLEEAEGPACARIRKVVSDVSRNLDIQVLFAALPPPLLPPARKAQARAACPQQHDCLPGY